HLPRDDHRDIVQLLRVGDRPELAALGLESCRLVVVRPVERVLVAGLGEQIWRRRALRDPRREPAEWRGARFLLDALAAGDEERALLFQGHLALALGIGMTVR